ncbi:MAG: tRNA uridine-5-carboxymethylaminomethyl(34) synthesis GTPase MnmE [Bacillota bacterium]
MQDTILALSTPVGGALAVVRLSGPKTKEILGRVFSGSAEHRAVNYGKLSDEDGMIDRVTCVYYAAPQSYTGEDMAEITTHGGQAVVRRAMAALLAAGARMAGPGELTRRAFINGKLDLTQAEAVMDLIDASAERGARAAAEQLEGSVSRSVNAVADALLDALSGINAAIDYPDELEEDVTSALPATLSRAKSELREMIEGGLRGRVVREGARLVLLGRTNAGKSSLMNALLGRERAIVTQYEGTTRDVLYEETEFSGLPVVLTDTAGLRETLDPVEGIGVSLARDAAKRADLLLLTFDCSRALDEQDAKLLEETKHLPRVALLSKSDLPPVLSAEELFARTGLEVFVVSAATGDGVNELKRAVAERLLPEEEQPLVTNARHIEALLDAKNALEGALVAQDLDCMATDIRAALIALNSITGHEVDEAVLERIFSRFCVGK